MPRQATVVQVFVASPSDVKEEREALERIVEELNRTWSQNLGIILELLKWETHVRPGFGSEPQSVINSQIGDTYDVFIGILWSRFGTPTNEFDSGTEQEFEHALKRFKETGSPEIMIYFKKKPADLFEVDLDQLAKIRKFQQRLGEEGGLYSFYEDDTAFATSARSHLASIAQQFPKSVPTSTRIPEPGEGTYTARNSELDHEDDFGYLDYVDIYNDRMAAYTGILRSITDATKRIATQIESRASELNRLNESGGTQKEVRRTLARAAADMDDYSESLRAQSPALKSARESSLNALSMALAVYRDFDSRDKDELKNLKDSLSNLTTGIDGSSGIDGSRCGLIDFRDSIGKIPRMTSELNKSKREVARRLDQMLIELDATKENVQNILDAIDQMLN